MKLFSVIIPTYKRFTTLKQNLNFFQNQKFPKKEYEIIIVFDGKDSLTSQEKNFLTKIEKKGFQLKVFLSPQKRGQAFCRNIGISQSDAKYLLFIDDDTLPHKLLLKHHALFLENNPQVASLGKVITLYPKNSKNFSSTLLAENSLIHLGIPSGAKLQPKNIYTGNLAIPKNNIFFPASVFHSYGYEDVALGELIQNKGLQLLKNNSAIVYHRKCVTYADLKKRAENLGKNFRLIDREKKFPLPSSHYARRRSFFKHPLKEMLYFKRFKDYYFSLAFQVKEP